MQITIQNYGSYELFDKIIKTIIGDDISNQTFIDLCSCEATATRNLGFKEKTYVDALDCWVIPGQMDRFIQADVLGDHEVFNKHYSVANCSDGIEHLTKEQGFKLVQRMEAISDKQILFTPYGEHMVEVGNPDPRCHKSGWWPEDFPDFASIVCPNWHPTLGIGAFWFWNSPNLETEMLKIKKILL
jgi:hypothetical protein